MKKNYLMMSLFALGLATTAPVGLTSCSSDDPITVEKENPFDYGDDVASAEDNRSAGEAFKCVEQILDGCIDIANEVGESKIGEPLNLFNSGQQEKALYAVESWYSYHSREDYRNNIYSIRNAYYGSLDGSVANNSLSALIASKRPQMDQKVKEAIDKAANAIWAIPDPFRNNINCAEALEAQKRCSNLKQVITDLKGYIEGKGSINQDANLDPIISDYVQNVVLPTYKALRDGNAALYDAVSAFQANPSDAAFKDVAQAWIEARQPWETSEAFLFGPVDSEGLDPNMDSWPLDQDQIATILNSGNFDNLDWSDGDNDETIEAKQGVRGFHTLEFLTFRNGKARTLNDVAESGSSADLVYNSTNARSWGNYMKQVAYLLKQDASNLYKYWTVSYNGGESFAKQFLSHNF